MKEVHQGQAWEWGCEDFRVLCAGHTSQHLRAGFFYSHMIEYVIVQ